MSTTGEIPAFPPWALSPAISPSPASSQTKQLLSDTKAGSWPWDTEPFLVRKFTSLVHKQPPLILNWRGALTPYPSFYSFVMSFPHTWCFGGSGSEVPRAFALEMLCIAHNSVFSTTCGAQVLFLLALVHPGQG